MAKAKKSGRPATTALKKAKPAKTAPPSKKALPAKKALPTTKPVHTAAKPRVAPLKGKPGAKAKPTDEQPPLKTNLNTKELSFYKDLLLKLRDRIIDEISFLANDNLNRSQKDSAGDLSSYSFHMADQGTDNFDREFAASLLSSEQDVLYEIDEAIRRIEQGSYGICEISGKPIEKARLKVLPFARYSVAVQTEMERGKPRYRPFRRISIQTAEPNP
jgi:RNA polymerase-binding transcription factor DksA